MRLMVNGEGRELAEPESESSVSVEALVAALELEPRGLAIAVNGEVVPRSTWPDHRLAEGDQIEILTVAQGG